MIWLPIVDFVLITFEGDFFFIIFMSFKWRVKPLYAVCSVCSAQQTRGNNVDLILVNARWPNIKPALG